MDWSSLKLVAALELRSARRSRWLRATVGTWLFLGAVLAWSATPPHLAFWNGWERTALSSFPCCCCSCHSRRSCSPCTPRRGSGRPGTHERSAYGASGAFRRKAFGCVAFGLSRMAPEAWQQRPRGFRTRSRGSPLPLLLVAGAGLLLAAALVAVGGWIAAGSRGRLAARGRVHFGVWRARVRLRLRSDPVWLLCWPVPRRRWPYPRRSS